MGGGERSKISLLLLALVLVPGAVSHFRCTRATPACESPVTSVPFGQLLLSINILPEKMTVPWREKKNSSRVICSCGLFTIFSPFCGAEPTDGSWRSWWGGGGVCWRGQGIQSVPQLGSPDAFVSTRPEERTPGLKKKAALRCQSSAGPLALSVGVEDSVPFSKEMIHLHRCHLPKHHSFSQ